MPKKKNQSEKIVKSKSYVSTILICVGIICVCAALYFGKNLFRTYRQHPPRRVREQNIATIMPWMTLRYIARTYGTPIPVLESALQGSSGEYMKLSITGIAAKRNLPVSTILETIQSTIKEFQAAHTTPPPR